MRQFNEFSALWRAPLLSKPFYRDVALRWRGIGLRYLLLILVLTWLILLVQWTIGISSFLTNEAPAALKDFPPITLRGGVASSPVAQPYVMNDSEGNPVFVFDTTGAVQSPKDRGARILVTASEIVQVNTLGFEERRSLRAAPDMTVDAAWILRGIRAVRNLLLPIGLVVFTLGSLAVRLLAALVLALLGLAFNAAAGGRLGFAALFRLAVVAMTTSILLDTVAALFRLPIGCFRFVLFPVISLGYMAFAVWTAASESRTALPVPAPPPGPADNDPLFP
jgi:hypothetical protein